MEDLVNSTVDFNILPSRQQHNREVSTTLRSSSRILEVAGSKDVELTHTVINKLQWRNKKSLVSITDVDTNKTVFYYIPAESAITIDPEAFLTVDKVLSDKHLNDRQFIFKDFPSPYYNKARSVVDKLRAISLALASKYLYDALLLKGFVLVERDEQYIFHRPFIGDALEDVDVKDAVEEHIEMIKQKYNIIEDNHVETRKYGRGVSLQALLKNINDMKWIDSVRGNIIKLLNWKLVKYRQLYKDFISHVRSDEKRIKDANLTADERKEFSGSSASIKLMTSNILNTMELVEDKIKHVSNLKLDDIQASYLKVYKILRTISDDEIISAIATSIATLKNGYQSFSTSFQNIVITSGAGAGKTTVAVKISSILRNMYVLSSDIVKIVSRSDLVASYLGQTAIKTKLQLFSTLEGVLFIDEAYQLAGCPTEDAFGMEGLTEIVNFLDKYVGLSVVIVAGYEKQMQTCFFDRNEGLHRRFPTAYKLKPPSHIQLLRIFLTAIIKSLMFDPFEANNQIELAYLLIGQLKSEGKIPNLGGDMQIMASNFITSYLSEEDVSDAILNSGYTYCRRYGDDNSCTMLVDRYSK